jgi:hypothetical protein
MQPFMHPSLNKEQRNPPRPPSALGWKDGCSGLFRDSDEGGAFVLGRMTLLKLVARMVSIKQFALPPARSASAPDPSRRIEFRTHAHPELDGLWVRGGSILPSSRECGFKVVPAPTSARGINKIGNSHWVQIHPY